MAVGDGMWGALVIDRGHRNVGVRVCHTQQNLLHRHDHPLITKYGYLFLDLFFYSDILLQLLLGGRARVQSPPLPLWTWDT